MNAKRKITKEEDSSIKSMLKAAREGIRSPAKRIFLKEFLKGPLKKRKGRTKQENAEKPDGGDRKRKLFRI